MIDILFGVWGILLSCLFKHDGTTSNDTYLIKNVIIPVGASLVLDNNVNVDTSVLSLKITTAGTSPDVSVMIE